MLAWETAGRLDLTHIELEYFHNCVRRGFFLDSKGDWTFEFGFKCSSKYVSFGKIRRLCCYALKSKAQVATKPKLLSLDLDLDLRVS